jgi:predicted Zn-dependent peptidase
MLQDPVVTEQSTEVLTLANGVRLVLVPMDRLRSVTCCVMILAGSRHETNRTRGVAHFLEHMTFKGTARRPTSWSISSEIDALGGELDGFTGKEYSGYYATCAADHQFEALDLLLDMVLHSCIAVTDIEHEKRVVIEEINASRDSPRDCLESSFDDLVFHGQSLGRNVLGTREAVQAVERQALLEFRDRWHRGPRIVIGVAGRIEPDTVMKIAGLAAEFDDQEPDAVANVAESESGPQVSVLRRDYRQAYLRIGVRSRAVSHPDSHTVATLATVLAGGISSRLYSEMHERLGLARYVLAHDQTYTDCGALHVEIGVAPDRVEEAVTTLVRELMRLGREPLSADELDVARGFARGRLVLAMEGTRGNLLQRLRGEILERDARKPERVLASFATVTAEDLQRVAAELIIPERLNLAVVGPVHADENEYRRLLTPD